MIRTVVAIAATFLGVTAVVAQVDAIAARKAIMKSAGDQAKIGSAMAKGEAPFDLAKAHAIFANYVEASQKMPNLFPDNSRTGDTAALPVLWDKKDDVNARYEKLGADSRAAEAATKDLDSFKASFSGVLKNCGGCHELYLAKKS